MIIKKCKKDSTFYWTIANFKNRLLYTNLIQITLKEPWLFPKYEDNFGGIPGLRLYGWLFFYFGRVYSGILYPSEEGDTGKGILDKSWKKWYLGTREQFKDFDKAIKEMKRQWRKGAHIEYMRTYQKDGKYNISVIVSK